MDEKGIIKTAYIWYPIIKCYVINAIVYLEFSGFFHAHNWLA